MSAIARYCAENNRPPKSEGKADLARHALLSSDSRRSREMPKEKCLKTVNMSPCGRLRDRSRGSRFQDLRSRR